MKTINNFMHKVFDWILTSSSDPTKTSLTVKASLTVGASALLQIIGLTHINLGIIDAAFLNNFINAISTAVLDVLIAVGSIGTVVGFVTKIWLTVTGKNPVVTVQPSVVV